MLDSELKCAEELDPTGYVTLRLFICIQPLKRGMVGTYYKFPPMKVVTKMLHGLYDGQQLFTSCSIFPFSRGVCRAKVRNYMFPAVT